MGYQCELKCQLNNLMYPGSTNQKYGVSRGLSANVGEGSNVQRVFQRRTCNLRPRDGVQGMHHVRSATIASSARRSPQGMPSQSPSVIAPVVFGCNSTKASTRSLRTSASDKPMGSPYASHGVDLLGKARARSSAASGVRMRRSI